MGNSATNPGVLHSEARLAAAKFDSDEFILLKKTWQELADRSNGKGIDKETFLQYFPLNGLLGERLFAQFDVKGTGLIDLDEFVTGLAIVCRGTTDEKIHFLFDMYDVSKDKTVSKQELSTLLNHVPKDVLQSTHCALSKIPGSSSNSNLKSVDGHESDSNSVSTTEDSLGGHGHHDDDYDEIDSYTNHDMVEKAFEECDLNHEGRLTYQEFKMWVERNPNLLAYFDNIMPYTGIKDQQPHHDKTEALPHMKRMSSRMSFSRQNSGTVSAVESTRRNSDAFSPPQLTRDSTWFARGRSGSNAPTPPVSLSTKLSLEPGATLDFDDYEVAEEKARGLLLLAMEATQNQSLKQSIGSLLETMSIQSNADKATEEYVVKMEGVLWKKGQGFLHAWTKRWYLLSGPIIYYYMHKEDLQPKGVIFLTGSLIERINDPENELKGYFGFEVLHQDLCTGEHHRHDQRVLYCRSETERDQWVNMIQHSAHVVPIEDDFVIGKELGRGRFSVVRECVNKVTGVHAAVKIIDKATMEPEEKGLLRTEIAVLKLVNHPNIIRMLGLYESKQNIYIVMEMLKGGELFERIVGRPRFSETEAAKLIRPLLESVAYLHDLGIVHRDLKPENILCGEELEDLKIADFGLSKMILPKEKMEAACGTLSYVAPEVLTMQGYGKEADLWSVGVIMFLLLCGKLPFDGDDHNEIIRSTIQAEIKVNPAVWGKLSEESRSLMQSLLNKNAKERITARDALRHPFIISFCPNRRGSIAFADGYAPNGDRSYHRSPSPSLSSPSNGSPSSSPSLPSSIPTTPPSISPSFTSINSADVLTENS